MDTSGNKTETLYWLTINLSLLRDYVHLITSDYSFVPIVTDNSVGGLRHIHDAT